MTAVTTYKTGIGTSNSSRVSGYSSILSVIAFLIAMIVALAFVLPAFSMSDVFLPALVASAFFLYSFFYCGRSTVNASSVASYGSLMFIGFPAMFGALGLYQSNKSYTPHSLIIVLLLAFVFQSILILCSDSTRGSSQMKKLNHNVEVGPENSSRVLKLSVAMMLLFVFSSFLGAGIAAAGFAWVAMLAGAAVVFWANRKRARVYGAILVTVTFILETGLALGSFGRLNLAVLALSILVIASLRLRSWFLKIAAVVFTGPILVYLVNQRIAYLSIERGTSQVSETEGLGSVVGPFHSAGAIVDSIIQGRISLAWGETLFNAAVTGVPRAIWPEKPVGFGREIVEVTQPWLASNSVFSDAGTFVGEAVWNFGIWLSPLYLVSFALFIRYLDNKLASFPERTPSFASFIVLMVISLLSGTLLNVIWGSASTAAARTLFPLAILLFLWFCTTQLNSRRYKQ